MARFFARIPEFVLSDDEGSEYDTYDAESAAEEHAEQCDDEHAVASGRNSWIVEVREDGATEWQRFLVSGEAIAHYFATKEDDRG